MTPPDSKTRFFEFGEAQVDSTWRTITFRQPFSDPIVVAKPPNNDNYTPALVWIRDVTPTGFALRIQEGDYLSSVHRPKTVGYLVVKRGCHTLEGNAYIEAGSKETSQTNSFDVKVAEESSTDKEIEQTTEVVGYMAFAFHNVTTDTDSDGLTNADEVLRYGTEPAAADTDQDGLSDGEEVRFWGTMWMPMQMEIV